MAYGHYDGWMVCMDDGMDWTLILDFVWTYGNLAHARVA